MNIDLTGRKALVTGSSRGIGRAVALELARCGAELVLHGSRISEKLLSAKAEIEALGGRAELLSSDLTKVSEIERTVAEMPDVDILVLNASVQHRKPWNEISPEDFAEQMNSNCLASLRLMQKASEYMLKKNWGRIITIGSVQEKKPHPEMIVYSSSKCAQTGLVLNVAPQLAPFGITVNNVAPGVIYTDRNVEALSDETYAKAVTDTIPCRYYGLPEDLCGTVCLLASDYGRYITGQSIFVDGGKSL